MIIVIYFHFRRFISFVRFQKIHCGDFRNFAYFRRYRPFFDEKADFWGYYWGKTKGCKMTSYHFNEGEQIKHREKYRFIDS